MHKKSIIILMGITMLTLGFTGCNKGKNPVVNEPPNDDTHNEVQTGENVEIKSTSSNQIAEDFVAIENVEDNNEVVSYVYSEDGETKDIEYDMRELSFDDWGFKINVPESLLNNYIKVDSFSQIKINDVDDMDKIFAVEEENVTFQLIKVSEKYFAIFRDNEEIDAELLSGLQSCDHKTIIKHIQDNPIFKISDLSPNSLDNNGNHFGVYYYLPLTPLTNKDFTYNGVAMFFVSGNHLYYVLYGESDLLDAGLVQRGYERAMVQSFSANEGIAKTTIDNNNGIDTSGYSSEMKQVLGEMGQDDFSIISNTRNEEEVSEIEKMRQQEVIDSTSFNE